MAHQIVATSVPRGLDGVSGYQTVLKSAGMPPRVFDRLKARSGYSHRYPHGDSRNPVVYVHRIEELGGSRWHVLGCIRDAGSDHTGRSNFLAHMLAIDAVEARGKLGGPAAAAMARGCFLEKWDGPPEPAAPAKTLVAADRSPQAGDAPAWSACGLDPGLAGDLAASAMANRKIVLVTRPGDDVLALFADALRLVEPSKRWAVTFNTCAIEDFDGTWKAIRADLAEAKDLREGKAPVIDLTTNPRGSADPYARFARGEADSLPWQKTTKAPEPKREEEAATPASVPKPGGGPPSRGPKEWDKNKNGKAGENRRRERRPRYEEEEPSRGPWQAIALAGIALLLVGVLVAIPFRHQLLALLQPSNPRPVVPLTELETEPVKPPSIDGKNAEGYSTLGNLKKARDRLEEGENGVNHDKLQKSATDLLTRLNQVKSKFEQELKGIIAKDGENPDPTPDIEKVISDCENVDKVLSQDSGAELEAFLEAEQCFKAAVKNLGSLDERVNRLEDDAKKMRTSQATAQKEADKRQRQQQAFLNFNTIVESVSLPKAVQASDVGLGGPRSAPAGGGTEIDLGHFAMADLVEPKFRLAVPQDKVAEDDYFKTEIAKVDGAGDPKWEIRYLPSAVGTEGKAVGPRPLAYLLVRDGHLWLDVPSSNELGLAPFALLRRSVILVEAKDPAAPAAPAVVQEIRLVEPTKVRPLVIDLFAEQRQELKITPPKGIARSVKAAEGTNATLTIPIESVRFEAEFPRGEKVNVELPKDVQEGSDPGIGKWARPLFQLNDDLAIVGVINLSLPQATMTVETKLTGKRAGFFNKQKIKEFFNDKPDEVLKNFYRSFQARVKRGKAFTLPQKQTKQDSEKIRAWFAEPLVVQAKNGMDMPGHETVAKSLELFLKERYAEASKNMKPGQLHDLPESWEDLFKLYKEVKDENEWQRVFTNRIDAWAAWFWPQFEKHWQENVKMFQGALTEKHEIRITRITSLAYDETGKEYKVPLVVFDDQTESPAETASPVPAGPAIGLD